jgi:hypothetical protein
MLVRWPGSTIFTKPKSKCYRPTLYSQIRRLSRLRSLYTRWLNTLHPPSHTLQSYKSHLDVAILPNEQVLRLEVPVHQVPLVQVLQRQDD